MKISRRSLIVGSLLFLICVFLHNLTITYTAARLQVSKSTTIKNGKGTQLMYSVMKRNKFQKAKHIFFLKTHKCGSTSVYKLFLRFGYNKDLTFVLPAENHTSTISDLPLEVDKGYFLPPPKGKHFDILCHHSVYNRTAIERILPKDTVYIGLVREPFVRFVSAILFFRKDRKEKYLTRIKSDNVISTYLENPEKYEPEGMTRSFTNNRMAYDFGLPPEDIKNPSKEKISKFIAKIDAEFDLVLVMEHFEESLILMRRILNWSFNDILYLGKSNVGMSNKTIATQNLTDVDRRRHRAWESIDIALYDHFLTKIKKTIKVQGQSFRNELEDFRRVRMAVMRYCDKRKLTKNLVVKTLHSREVLKVRPYDCKILKISPFAYFKMLKQTKNSQRVRRGHSQRVRRSQIKSWKKLKSKRKRWRK